jgi:hypothetical protein
MSRQVFFQIRHRHRAPCRDPASRDDELELAAQFQYELGDLDLPALLPPMAARLIARFIEIERTAELGKHPFPFADVLAAMRALAALIADPPPPLRPRLLAASGANAPIRRLAQVAAWLARHEGCGEEVVFDLWCSTAGYA